ncbi:MAG: type VI secretion system tube protein Hcp [Rhodobacteraceae bacterium]|nr:type VI secretion system tube protein Hcp [Paracoccaceae bacterium]
MSFFTNSFDNLEILARISGVDGRSGFDETGIKLDDVLVTDALALSTLDFSFGWTAQSATFGGEDGANVDYDPRFSLSLIADSPADELFLLGAVRDNTIFDSMSIYALKPDGADKGSDLDEVYEIELENVRFFTFATNNAETYTFGVAFSDITMESTPFGFDGLPDTPLRFDAPFDSDVAGSAKAPNLAVEQSGPVDGADGDQGLGLRFFYGDEADPRETLPTTSTDWDVNSFDLSVFRPFGAGANIDGTPVAEIPAIRMELEVLGRGELAEFLQKVVEGKGVQDEISLVRYESAGKSNPITDQFKITNVDAPLVLLGGVTLGGDGVIQLVMATPSLETKHVLIDTDGSAGMDAATSFAQTTWASNDGGARQGLHEDVNAFIKIDGIDGGLDQAGRETDFELVDFQIGFGMSRTGIDLPTGPELSPARPDFQPLVIEIAPHSYGSGQLLEAFQTGQRIGSATLDVTKAVGGDDVQIMTFTDLEVLSFGTGLNRNTVVELGYNGWKLETVDSSFVPGSGDIDRKTQFDFTQTIQQSRTDINGKFIDVSELDSLFKVGAGSAIGDDEAQFTGFLAPIAGILTGDVETKGQEDSVAVQEFNWSAYRENGKVNFSGLGLAVEDAPQTALQLQKLTLDNNLLDNVVLSVKDSTAADELAKFEFEKNIFDLARMSSTDGLGAQLGTDQVKITISPGSDTTTSSTENVEVTFGTVTTDNTKTNSFDASIPEGFSKPEEKLFLFLPGIEGGFDANGNTALAEFEAGNWVEIDTYGLAVAGEFGTRSIISALDIQLDPGDPAIAAMLSAMAESQVFSNLLLRRVSVSERDITSDTKYEFSDVVIREMSERSGFQTEIQFGFDLYKGEFNNGSTSTEVERDFVLNKSGFAPGDGIYQNTNQGGDGLPNPSPLNSSLRYFVTLTGVEGTSASEDFTDAVEIFGYEFNMANLAGISQEGDVRIAPLTITGNFGDGALFDILERTADGRGFAELKLEVVRERDGPLSDPFQTITLNNVYLNSLTQDELDVAKMEFLFSQIKYEARQFDDQGTLSKAETVLDLGRNDLVAGSDLDDSLFGGKGNDTQIGASGRGNDSYDGGEGVDTLILTSATLGIDVDLTAAQDHAFGVQTDTDQISNIENFIFGDGSDTFVGDGADNLVEAGGGDDLIKGGGGNDSILGGAGDDTLMGDNTPFGMLGMNAGSVTDQFVVSDAFNAMPTDAFTVEWLFRGDTQPAIGTSTVVSSGTSFVSYGVPGNTNEFLVFGATGGNISIFVNGNQTFTTIPTSTVFDGAVHRMSVSVDTTDGPTGRLSLYIDGEQVFTGPGLNAGVGSAITPGGTFILGQEQDGSTPGGGFDPNQIIKGEIGDIRVWSTERTASEIEGNHLRRFETGDLPSNPTLVANWQLDVQTALFDNVAGSETLLKAPSTSPYTAVNTFPGSGHDTIEGGPGADIMDGGEGDRDVLSYAGSDAGVTINLETGFAQGGHATGDTFTGFEDFIGSGFNDAVFGGRGNSSLMGGAGNDNLVGDDGQDTLRGGINNDTLRAGNISDHIVAGEIYDGGEGNDTFAVNGFSPQSDDYRDVTLLSLETLEFSQSLSDVSPGELRATFNANQFAAAGFTSIVGRFHDELQFVTAIMMDTSMSLDLSGVSVSGFDGPNDRIEIIGDDDAESILGTQGDDAIWAYGGDDILIGGLGDDFLWGYDGDDRLIGEDGNDTLDAGDGADTLNGGEGDDVIYGGLTEADLRDLVFAGGGNDYVDGGHGNDSMFGGDGGDTILGGFGVDTVIGNAGNDVLTGSAFSDVIFGNDGDDFINGGFGHDRVNGGTGADKFFHIGQFGHGRDWIQDYNSAEGDVLQFGGGAASASDFLIQRANTVNAGQAGVNEIFVTHVPSGNLLWALVDGDAQAQINIQIGNQVFDLLV